MKNRNVKNSSSRESKSKSRGANDMASLVAGLPRAQAWRCLVFREPMGELQSSLCQKGKPAHRQSLGSEEGI